MLSTIILQNGAPRSNVEKLVAALGGTLSSDIALISRGEVPASTGISQMIAQGQNLTTTLRSVLDTLKEQSVLLIDARIEYDVEQLCNAITAALQNDGTITYIPIQHGDETVELPELSTESLVSTIGSYTQWPTQIVIAKKNILANPELEGRTWNQLLAQAMIRAASEDEVIAHGTLNVEAGAETSLDEVARLSDVELAGLLVFAVRSNNIEDLFPRHAWNDHKEESAAASYHSLAALFVRLGDVQSAMDCLKLSDRLEDSPRSLALKGIIALEKGEILGAVANMVSSLQQYELRKKNDGKHYLSFAPNNLEAINSKLNAGLQALNKRDNKTALGHFAQAVFNFDDFYSEFGIDKVVGTIN